MLTQTHVFLSAAVFGIRRPDPIVWAAVLGALVPDSDVWAMIVTEWARGTPGCETFHYRYLEEPWTTLQAVMNSVPLYALILAGSLLARSAGLRVAIVGIVFASSALLHLSADFLLHHDDARRHFWPLSDWIFRSPVSYWDPQHYGRYFSVAEMLLGVVLATVLWRNVSRRWIRVLIAAAFAGYLVTITASLMGKADHYRGPGSCELMQLQSTSDL